MVSDFAVFCYSGYMWKWFRRIVLGVGCIGFLIFIIAAYNGVQNDKRLENEKKFGKNTDRSTFEWPDPDVKTITSVPVDLTQILSISKYRSCSGHDRAGYNFQKTLETDRSMKHYLFPIAQFQGTTNKIKLFAPFDGIVAMVQWVNPDGTKVRSDWLRKDGRKDFGKPQTAMKGGRRDSGNDIDFVSKLDENAVFGFRHVIFTKDFQIGDTVKSGEFIGFASVSEIMNDFDIDYVGREYKQEGDSRVEILDSMFNHMTPGVLAEFAKYGLTPENTQFSKEYRDINPCGYRPDKFGSTACKPTDGEEGNESRGRDNDCWISLKH